MLDLFCGAGGAGMGYFRAGFDVTGVDIKPQPRYPFPFILGDAMALVRDKRDGCLHLGPEVCLGPFDAIHASPPCPRYSASTPEKYRAQHPDLVGATRLMIAVAAAVWVVENVPGAPVVTGQPGLFTRASGVTLCGSMFGMKRLRRHRHFESFVPMPQPECRHSEQSRPILSVTGSGYGGKHPGHNGTKPDGIEHARQVMGIDWPMTIDELSDAIPPVYTEFIGAQLLAVLPHSSPDGG